MHWKVCALALSLSLLAGCGGSGGSDPPPPPADTTAPSVPQGLTATPVGPTRIDLQWTASTDSGGADLSGYRLFRGGTQIASVNAPATSYSDTTVVANTSYSYSVRAFDAANPPNVSADSTAAAATTPATAPVVGLDARPSNTSCIAPARPQPATTVQLARVFPNLPSFSSPIGLLQAPADASRWFVVEQAGRVRVFANNVGTATSSSFIDIAARVVSGGEQGLLGMAFHPQWPATPEVFLSYTRPSPRLQSVISRFSSSDGGATLNPASEQVLLTVDQPFTNHNGGHIAFGPDGYLYIGLGDGGSGGDPQNNAQNLRTLLGKMVRIEVRGTGAAYTIPADNPYAANPRCSTGTGGAACPEMWAFGFRNPWRWSFDRGTGDLWLGDVGQGSWEEVNRVTRGGNYGWRFREGAHCYNPSSGCPLPGTVQNGGLVIDPVTEYDHGGLGGQSITGGYVYRGTLITSLRGNYVFGDFASGRLWSHTPGAPALQKQELLDTSISISTFGEAVDGELYVANYANGQLLQLQPAGGAGTDTIPQNLAATGCVDATDPTRPAAGLIPYAPAAPFWSDGAQKGRWIGLPNGQSITANASGDWDFPPGTVLVKDFRLGGQLIETRLFMRHPDGVWAGYTYEWNAGQTAATRVTGGKTRVVGAQTWTYPSEQQCLQCHTEVAGRSLGLETAQQNSDLLYPQTGRTANQVLTLNTIAAISPAIPGTQASWPRLYDPYGAAGTVGERARSWLHTNCAQCHRPGGPTPTNLDLRYTTALTATNACDVTPNSGDLGIANARIIAPGAAARSVLLERIRRLDQQHRMPPLGSNVVDDAGVQLLTQWVNGLANCN